MKKTTKMAICAALVASANLFAPAMPVDNVALSVVAPSNAEAAVTWVTDDNGMAFVDAVKAYEKARTGESTVLSVRFKAEYTTDHSVSTTRTGELISIDAYIEEAVQWVSTQGNNTEENINKVKALYTSLGQPISVDLSVTSIATNAQSDANTALDAIYGQDTDSNGTRDGGGLADDVSDLKTSVGDANSGLTKEVGDLKTSVGDANSGLTKEVNTLKSTVASLGSSGGASSTDLNNEITRSTTKDTEHDTKLADHETRITSNTSRIGALESVTATHTAQIANHERRIDDLEDIAVDHEKRITANTKAIAQEVKERKAEVKRLDGRIDQETAERKAADYQLLQNDYYLNNKINREAQIRAAYDQQLQRNIDAEAFYRRQADEQLRSEMNSGFNRLDKKFSEGVAMALATAGLKMPEFDASHKWSGAVGVGHFSGYSAIAFGMFYQPTRDISYNMSISSCGSRTGMSGGMSFRFN